VLQARYIAPVIRWVAVAAAVLASACGRIAFDAAAVDAQDGDGADADAACAWGPFGAPVRLLGPVLAVGTDDWFPTPTRGELEIFFHSYRAGSLDAALWHATRTTTADLFGTPVRIVELDEAGGDSMPTLSEDGLVLVFARSAAPGEGADLFEARRSTPTSAFGAAVPLASLNTAFHDATPWLDASGLRLAYASYTSGSGAILESTRASLADPFGTPRRIDELDTSAHENSPTLSSDGLELFFTANPADTGTDVYRALRPALDQPFGPPSRVAELSSPRDEFGLRLSRDGRRMYFNYDALLFGGGDADLWVAERSCL
jgi:hypothetical protein